MQKKRLFPKKESDFIRGFMKELEKIKPNMYYFKSHGEPMQVRGIPDIVASVNGLFYGIEFKIMRAGKVNVTPYQQNTINEIIASGAYAFVIWWDENNGDVGVNLTRFRNIEEAVYYVEGEMDEVKKALVDEFVQCRKAG